MSAAIAPLALYEGVVVHRRSLDVPHSFRRRVWMPMVDLDRVDEVRSMWPLWSSSHPSVLQLRRTDYGGASSRANRDPRSLAAAVRDLVEQRTGRRPLGHVRMLAHVRTWGWLFNPLAVYYCYDADEGEPVAVVLEVTSTPWGERTQHVLDVREEPGLSRSVRKRMHVSPFLPRDLVYDMTVSPPGERCAVSITARQGGRAVFTAAFSLTRRPASRRRLLAMLVRHPLLTHRVSAGIYTHAARLRLKGAKYVAHAAVEPVGVEP